MDDQLYLIVRADDCGSNQSVNKSVLDVYNSKVGMMRNVSLMANGFAIEDAARMFAEVNTEELCFGVHLTLNAEWDRVRWGAVSSKNEVPSLYDKEGFLHQTPLAFEEAGVSIDEVFLEMDKQLEKLRTLGFNIIYADEHMAFGNHLTGYEERFARWCEKSGVINWRNCLQRIPPLSEGETHDDIVDQTIKRLEQLNSGIYTLVTHPAYESEEMNQLGTENNSGEAISFERNNDRLMLKSKKLLEYCRRRNIRCIRYDEAVALM